MIRFLLKEKPRFRNSSASIVQLDFDNEKNGVFSLPTDEIFLFCFVDLSFSKDESNMFFNKFDDMLNIQKLIRCVTQSRLNLFSSVWGRPISDAFEDIFQSQ